MADFDTFSQSLRGGLKHLYDPDYLRRGNLAIWFGVAERYDTPSLVQSILIKGIEALRPAQKTIPLPSEQQNYDVLLYRYIQQSSQEEVSHQLGVSPRQLRRIQAIALEALATSLWKTYRNHESLAPSSPIPQAESPLYPTQGIADDFAWIKNAPVTDPANPVELTEKSLDLLQPLAIRHHVSLAYKTRNILPPLAVHPIALRQILLSLLGDIIQNANSPDIEIVIEQINAEVCFSIIPFPAHPDQSISLDSKGILDARQITLLSNGRLEAVQSETGTRIQLYFPAVDQIKIIAIDDNTDIVELMQRYLAGTRYILIGINRAVDAVDLILQEKPRLILLDVMIPEVDGWELLGQLHRHPLTAHIPIIICSILAQEEFALTLGAVDFIQKPVRREILLQVLDRAAATLEQGSP